MYAGPATSTEIRAARSSESGSTAAPPIVAGVRITHPQRLVYPVLGTTKHDLARFYKSIGDWILPQLRGRPLTVVRCPDGVGPDCFYMKHSGVWAPSALRRLRIREKTKVGEYLVVEDLVGLVSLVQMGILEIHTWNSRADHLELPDRAVFDLDPGPAVPWPDVVNAARLVRTALHDVGLESFVKTTGGVGLHVVVPLRPQAGWDDVYEFSRRVAEAIVRHDPGRYTTEMPKATRRSKILVDFLRNRRGNTSVAAYSTRARPSAPMSTPITWDELGARVGPDRYTIGNLSARLARLRADPWARYATVSQELPGGASVPRERRRTAIAHGASWRGTIRS